jgi:hypothetical protein
MKIYYYESQHNLIHPQLLDLFRQYTPCELIEAPQQLKEVLDSWDGMEDLVSIVANAINFEDCRILITTNSNSYFQEWCIAQYCGALWGCSNEYISVDYAPEHGRLANQLHECLHFLGVKDCYVESDPEHPPKASCTNPTCVMRFGVNSTEVCKSVIDQVQQYPERSAN